MRSPEKLGRPMPMYCIYFPERDVYQGAATKTREAVPGIFAFRHKKVARAMLKVLDRDGAVLVTSTEEELIAVGQARKNCGCLMVMDDLLKPEMIYF